MKSVILMNNRPPHSILPMKLFLTTALESLIFLRKKVGIDFHVVVKVKEATQVVASFTGKI